MVISDTLTRNPSNFIQHAQISRLRALNPKLTQSEQVYFYFKIKI